ncbi:EamA family transporter, partial [Klebsiella pneumoniae]|uniref:EamA family transporter n=1 Tax=Klebsiella pneumoniae TaxID=573 RepID=UPI0011581093
APADCRKLAIFVRLLCVTLLGGVGTMGSYGLALWAMTQAPLAVVAALRDTSILFGAFIAFVLLKEKVVGLRIAAALGIAAGAVLLRLA